MSPPSFSLSKLRRSLSWTSKKDSTEQIITTPTNLSSKSSSHRRNSTLPVIQDSPFLVLPIEIQYHVLSFVLTPWTMAILNSAEYSFSNFATIALRGVGSLLVSGPPGISLLTVCRALYDIAHPRFGQHCTGRLVLGEFKGRFRRNLFTYLTQHTRLERFYSFIHTAIAYVSLDHAPFGLNLRNLFPNLQYAECTVHEGGFGPLLRLNDTSGGFLVGEFDDDWVGWTRPTVNYFLGLEGHSVAPLFGDSKSWNDETAVVDVLVLGSTSTRQGTVLGLRYRWEGGGVRIVACVVRDPTNISYWEQGRSKRTYKAVPLHNGEQDIPERFRWVKVVKW